MPDPIEAPELPELAAQRCDHRLEGVFAEDPLEHPLELEPAGSPEERVGFLLLAAPFKLPDPSARFLEFVLARAQLFAKRIRVVPVGHAEERSAFGPCGG